MQTKSLKLLLLTASDAMGGICKQGLVREGLQIKSQHRENAGSC
jgi:hypothetical protein